MILARVYRSQDDEASVARTYVYVTVGRATPPRRYTLARSPVRLSARNRSAGSGRRPCEWATVLRSAARVFLVDRNA